MKDIYRTKMERVKRMRKSLKMTQTQFGEVIGVGVRMVRHYEAGSAEVPRSIDLLLDHLEANIAAQVKAQTAKQITPMEAAQI